MGRKNSEKTTTHDSSDTNFLDCSHDNQGVSSMALLKTCSDLITKSSNASSTFLVITQI